MTIHKSKGKEFDEVIVYEGRHSGRIVHQGATEKEVAQRNFPSASPSRAPARAAKGPQVAPLRRREGAPRPRFAACAW